MPVRKMSDGAIEDLVVRDGLVDDAAQPVRAGLGRDRDRPLAALLEQADDRFGQVVEPQRGRADAVAHRDEPLEDRHDVRVIAQRDGDEADALGVRPRGLGQLEDAGGGKRPHGQVVVAGPAESAQIGAAADDFDQQARSELRVGREDRRARRIEPIRGLDRGLPDDRRGVRVRPRHDARDAPRAVVHDVVERRHVEPARAGEPGQKIVATVRVEPGVDERRHEQLRFAGGDDVRKRRERLGIDERHGAADDDERIARVPLGGARLHAREPQHRHDVGVVPLERDREREDVEIVNGRLGLDRDERLAPREQGGQILLGRQEHALADDALVGVEQPVDGLQAEVGHPDEVGVRERERHAQPAAVGLAHRSHFAGEQLAGLAAAVERPAARGPGRSGGGWHGTQVLVRTPRLTRRRGRGSWYWRLYLRE